MNPDTSSGNSLFIIEGTLMRVSDDHESLVRLKHRIERHNQREREAIARGRAEWEKWLKEKSGIEDQPGYGRHLLADRL
jgi:hypothetical protein